MTHDIIRLILQPGIEGYTYIWLQSEYARQLINAYAYGSVVSHIEREHLESVNIPLLKNMDIQSQINDLALEANVKRYEAYKLEQQALKIMDDEVINAK
jgi:type I restriction enzyme, S subunit